MDDASFRGRRRGPRRDLFENRSDGELSNSDARRRNSGAQASVMDESNDGARRNFMTVRRRRSRRDALENRLDDELLNSYARRRNSTQASVTDQSNDGAQRNSSENRSDDELSNSTARRRNPRARASVVNESNDNDGARRNSCP